MNLSHVDETELIRRAQANDEAAFQELMRRTASTSMRLALSIVKNRQEAEDQVQNSFVNAWKRLGSFQFEAKFSTWLRTIVVNQSLMYLRSKRRAPMEPLDPGVDGSPASDPADRRMNPEELLNRAEMNDRLRREVRLLPPILRDVLVLRDIEELPTDAVAARLGISEPAAKSRLARARQLLRQRMERHLGRTSALLA